MKAYTEDELVELRDRNETWLMKQTSVTGTGIGLGSGGELVLRIFTVGATPETRRVISSKLSGVPIAWEEGDIVAE